MSSVRTTLLLLIMLGVLIFLQYRLWFEVGGLRDMNKFKKMLAVQVAENDELKKQNNELLSQIGHIQNSQEAAEARARSELGMVKQDETFYQVVK